jgi:hypothetical protein
MVVKGARWRSGRWPAMALALLFCLGASHDPVAPGPLAEREIGIVNHSAHTIVELYVSPSSADAWGTDRLGDRQIDAGARLVLPLGRTRDCGFDVLAVYDDASREEIHAVNLCRIKLVTVDGSQATPPPLPSETVTLVNASRLPIQQLFISPPDAAQWGDDLLTTSGLSVGEQRDITYQGSCEADVRVVFTNRAAEERRGLNLCTRSRLRIAPGWTTAEAP